MIRENTTLKLKVITILGIILLTNTFLIINLKQIEILNCNAQQNEISEHGCDFWSAYAQDIFVNNDTIFIVFDAFGLVVYNISNPIKPIQKTLVCNNSVVTPEILTGNDEYTFAVKHISHTNDDIDQNKSKIILAKNTFNSSQFMDNIIKRPNEILEILYDGRYLYLLEWNLTNNEDLFAIKSHDLFILCYDMLIPEKPVFRSSIEISLPESIVDYGFDVKKSHFYVTNNILFAAFYYYDSDERKDKTCYEVLNFTNYNPIVIKSYPDLPIDNLFFIDTNILIATNKERKSLYFYDYSDLKNIYAVKNYFFTGSVSLYYENNVAYLQTGSGLEILDVSDIMNIKKLANFDFDDFGLVYVKNGLAYLTISVTTVRTPPHFYILDIRNLDKIIFVFRYRKIGIDLFFMIFSFIAIGLMSSIYMKKRKRTINIK
ncbi:MAG: hypothetical protein ACFFDW_13580 [Candidatus Thorarchaeota archaeon]